MKIYDAIKLADDCGLKTVGEAVRNVEIHANQLFSYSEKWKELDELRQQYNWILKHRQTPDGRARITHDMPVSLMLKYHIGEDMVDYDMYYRALKDKYFAKQLGEE